ncbi:MAG TPA: hypothetical protein VEJ63_07530 [Planctomycetota bacterium]|nr:hypothetical protein [Planctomycetota bacterium]
MRKRETELEGQKSRLLDAFLSGAVEKDVYQAKNEQLMAEFGSVREKMAREVRVNAAFIEMAERAFDMAQNAAKTWMGSNSASRRELLQILSLNRELDETSFT